jgi:ABC-type transport system involved in multi-copper enzyme maturation permease subunit
MMGQGLIFGVRGLVEKELRARSRGWRSAILRTFYLGVLAAAVAGFLALVTRLGVTMPPNIGVHLFSALVVLSVLMLAFITPALTASSVSGERERRTLDLLLVTRSSSLGLSAGKVTGPLVYVLFLLVASLPAISMVYLFGGIPLHYVVLAFVVSTATALTHAAIGLLLSAVLKRTAVAMALSYLLVIFLVFGIPIISIITGIVSASQSGRYSGGAVYFGGSSGATSVSPSGLQGKTVLYGTPLPGYAVASPLTALGFALPGGSAVGYGGSSTLVGDMLRMAVGGGRFMSAPIGSGVAPRVTYIVLSDPSSGTVEVIETWSPWVLYLALSAVIVTVSLLLSALALAPIKPWRRWRAGHRPRPVSEATTS